MGPAEWCYVGGADRAAFPDICPPEFARSLPAARWPRLPGGGGTLPWFRWVQHVLFGVPPACVTAASRDVSIATISLPLRGGRW